MKRRSTWFWVLVLVAVVVAWWFYNGQTSKQLASDTNKPTATYADLGSSDLDVDDVIVDFDDDVSTSRIAAIGAELGVTFEDISPESRDERLYRAHVDPARRDAIVARLRTLGDVAAAEPDMLYSIPEGDAVATPVDAEPGEAGFPNDPKYKYQWHLRQIEMPEAWKVTAGKEVIVAVIDTGIAKVPDLAGTEIIKGYDFVNKTDKNNGADDHGHGTHVAGTIAQSTNNGVGVAGIAYKAKLMPLKVLSARGSGSVAGIADAIYYATDHGAKVINMSLGGGMSSKVLAKAVKHAHDNGVVVVCAAGNDGRGKVSFPAAYPGAIAVAATRFDRKTTHYSNWGKEIDVAAPGGDTRVDQNGDGMPDGVLQNTIVPGDIKKNDYLMFQGTSMASPHVAGVAALLVSQGISDPDAVESIMKATAKNPSGSKWDAHYGSGIVDAAGALSKVNVTFGWYQLGFALLAAAGIAARLLDKKALGIRYTPGFLGALVVGSSGLFFLRYLGLGGLPGAEVITHGFPSWDRAVLGLNGHGNPLFFSALVPMALVGLGYGVKRLRPVVAGFAIGVAAHLMFQAAWELTGVRWVPSMFGFGQIWLIVNALICLAAAYLVARE